MKRKTNGTLDGPAPRASQSTAEKPFVAGRGKRTTWTASRVSIAALVPPLSMAFLLESLLLALGEIILLGARSVAFALSAIKND